MIWNPAHWTELVSPRSGASEGSADSAGNALHTHVLSDVLLLIPAPTLTFSGSTSQAPVSYFAKLKKLSLMRLFPSGPPPTPSLIQILTKPLSSFSINSFRMTFASATSPDEMPIALHLGP